MHAAKVIVSALILVLLLVLVLPAAARLLRRLFDNLGGRPRFAHSRRSIFCWMVAAAFFLACCSDGSRSYASGILASAYNLVMYNGSNLTRRQTIEFTGGGVTAADNGSRTVVTVAGSGGLNNYAQTFTSQTSVSLTHNLGTTATLTDCYDGSGNLVIPTNIARGTNTNTVTFGVSTTGGCVVNGGGANGGAIIGTSVTVNGASNSPVVVNGVTQSFVDFWYSGASKGQIGACTTGPCILDSAGNIAARWDNGGSRLMTTGGNVNAPKYQTQGNCASVATPAVCTSAATGRVAINTGATTLTVNTTAVASTSEIFLTFDSSLGSALGVTCNATYTPGWVTAKSAGTSFSMAISTTPASNYACFSYSVVN